MSMEVIKPSVFTDDIARTERRTPHGYVPGGVAGYIVDECTILCPDCVDKSELTEENGTFNYDYVGGFDEWDFPGATCEGCHATLNTNVLIYKEGPGSEHFSNE